MQTETQAEPRTTKPRRGRLILFAMLWVIVATGVAVAYLTYAWFANPVTADPETVASADAVVLFAGSGNRLETAIEMVERGVAPNLVLPNGAEIDGAESLCEGAADYAVFCPATDEVTTIGEARAVGRLAEEQGWSRLIAVTSVYHVHRATYLLDRCHEGPVDAVATDRDTDIEDLMEEATQEWIAYLGSVILQPAC